MSSRWVPPQPRDLRCFREDMELDLQRHTVIIRTVQSMALGLGSLRPAGPPAKAAAFLLREERVRLHEAKLYSVSADMTQVAVAAGRKLPSWEVREEDVPDRAPSGLIVYDTPIVTYNSDNTTDPVEIVAVSWGPTDLIDGSEDTLWLTFWSVTPAQDIDSFGQLTWDNESTLTFGATGISIADGDRKIRRVDFSKGHVVPETTASWVQTVRATWLLLKRTGKRPIAEVSELPHSRTVRRTMEREGYDPSPVRVVTLHRTIRPRRRAAADDGGGYTIGKRYYVEGHVRWQPYPTRGVIEPIWIEDQTRGPEGAPWSQPKTKVHRLDRPPKT